MQAALGVAQLENLEKSVKKKREIGNLYNELLSDIENLQLPLVETDYAENIYWVYGVILKESISFDAKSAMSQLGQSGIGSRPFFCPMHLQPALINMGLFENEKYPTAENLYKRGFYLPSGLALTESEIVRVSESLRLLIES